MYMCHQLHQSLLVSCMTKNTSVSDAHHSRLDMLCQAEQMHVAGVALVPHGGDANLRPGHVLLLQTCRGRRTMWATPGQHGPLLLLLLLGADGAVDM